MPPTSKLFLSLTISYIVLVGYTSCSNGAPSRGSVLSTNSLIADPHIIKGVNTNIEQIPYQISLEAFQIHFCGGAIISERWAITAAHCVSPHGRADLRIRAGSTTAIPAIGWGGSIHQIDFTSIHKLFSSENLDYDIGVVRVEKNFHFGSRIKPISISDGTEKGHVDYSQKVTVSGYGQNKIGGKLLSLHLKSAQIPLIPRDKCQAMIIPDGIPMNVSVRMICAGGTGEHGSDVAKGDSGGPMVQNGRLIGLVSWGLRDFDADLPSVFTNLLDPEIRSYIREHTKV